jgi:hypothetical protein
MANGRRMERDASRKNGIAGLPHRSEHPQYVLGKRFTTNWVKYGHGRENDDCDRIE